MTPTEVRRSEHPVQILTPVNKALGESNSLHWLGLILNLRLRMILLSSCLLLVGCDSRSNSGAAASKQPAVSFLAQRRSATTNLTLRGPAPQTHQEFQLESGFREVRYSSGGLELKAWFAKPEVPIADATTESNSRPGLVYFHSGHAVGSGDLEAMRPFMDAGFAVLVPSLRGENGNPGDFELFWGEFDDACEAVRWLAEQPEVNASQMYSFGHSVGGGISSLLSLASDDLPLKHSASCGGIYSHDDFSSWDKDCPFNFSDVRETKLRMLAGNQQSMKRDHIAYVGNDDTMRFTANRIAGGDSRVRKVEVLGDHLTSFPVAAANYLEFATNDLGQNDGRSGQVTWSSGSVSKQSAEASDSAEPEIWDVIVTPPTQQTNYLPIELMYPIAKDHKYQMHIDREPFNVLWRPDHSVEIVDTRDFTVTAKLNLGFRESGFLSISPSGKRASYMVRSTYPDSALVVVDTQSGRVVKRIQKEGLHGGLVHFLDDRTIMTYDITKRYWAIDTDSQAATELKFGGRLAGSIEVSPTGDFVATITREGYLVVCDSRTGRQIGKSAFPKAQTDILSGSFLLWDCSLSPDGLEFTAGLTANGQNWFVSWDMSTGRITQVHNIKIPYRQIGMRRRLLTHLDQSAGWLVNDGSMAIGHDSGEVIWMNRETSTGPKTRVLPGNRVMAQVGNSNAKGHVLMVKQMVLRDPVESERDN